MENVIKLNTCKRATEDDEPVICFFSKKQFRPLTGLIGMFDGRPVSLDETLKRNFEIGEQFDRPDINNRMELAEWLDRKGVARRDYREAYAKLYFTLGAGLDAGPTNRLC